MRRFAASVTALMLTCAAAALADEPLTLDTRPVALSEVDDSLQTLGTLRYLGGLALTSANPAFEGLSGLHVDLARGQALMISDRGHWVRAALALTEAGAPTALSNAVLAPIRDSQGRSVANNRQLREAEGLTPLGGGRFAVSFEARHRIEAYDLGLALDQLDARAETAVAAPDLAGLADNPRRVANGGLEGLASDARFIWTAAEYPLTDGAGFSLWRYDRARPDAAPQAYALALDPAFGITSLDSDDAGGLFLLQRFWSAEIGNRIRILHLSADQLATPGEPALVPRLLAELPPSVTLDNLEGLDAVNVGGETRLYLISDDNGRSPEGDPDYAASAACQSDGRCQRHLLLAFALSDDWRSAP